VVWRLRFGLRTLLIAATLGVPLVAWFLRPVLIPPAWTAGGNLSIADAQANDPLVDVVWVPGTRTKSLSHIIVRPGIPRWLPGGTEHINFANSDRVAPSVTGISLRRQLVFLDGKQWHIQNRPCFLVFDPITRGFAEIPIADIEVRIRGKDDVALIPEWKSEVIPILREIDAAWREDMLRSTQERRAHAAH